MLTHHIAIQTHDLANAIAWYKDFFGANLVWELGTFSATTRRRLPGIRALAELQAAQVRFHIFERDRVPAVRDTQDKPCFQHVCLEVEHLEALEDMRRKWIALHESGRFTFVSGELPTEIEWDGSKSASFYLLDVNGVEYELTWMAGTPAIADANRPGLAVAG